MQFGALLSLWLVSCVPMLLTAPLAQESDFGRSLYALIRRDICKSVARDSQPEEELGDKFEGDMVLSGAQRRALDGALSGLGRNGLRAATKRWPDRIVRYHVVEEDFDENQIKMIENGMATIANKSCIKFLPRKSNEEHAVTIKAHPQENAGSHIHWGVRSLKKNDKCEHNLVMLSYNKSKTKAYLPVATGNGCYSNVGYNPGASSDDGEVHQSLNLAKGCFRHGTVVHEMLHTLGFYHMQSTYDRDDYVKINWENIIPVKLKTEKNVHSAHGGYAKVFYFIEASGLGYAPSSEAPIDGYTHVSGTEHNFAKYNNDTVTDFGVPYDYGSVMHYGDKAFSKNGNKTIEALQENVTIGQRDDLSESDILKLNRMYCESSAGGHED
ncbi:Zinc metalloproteinase nas-13 [Eumeta japonica]|uniref:Zinc metalloproteinase nas-13 n=1 Tax=Eumeta variegata TaxID=151549 RepID=A0A4C1TFK4_EUMVA|nr:Zinc metalloproteinase nas-13 [Eumeta japonica]